MNFKNEGYMTRGYAGEIPTAQQLFIFGLIEKLKNGKEQCDYLQVFKLSGTLVDGKRVQKIVHSQEQPPSSQEYLLSTDSIVEKTVFVIDDETHHTYLLAEEY